MRRLLRLVSRLPLPLRSWLRRLPGITVPRERLIQLMRDRALGRPGGPPPAAGELRPVIYLPTWVRWDAMRQRPHALLEAFADAGHPVYFVDPTEKTPRADGEVRIVPSLRHVPGRGVILYLHFAPLRRYATLFGDPVIVYDILDDLSIYRGTDRHRPAELRVDAHHLDAVSAADIVLASSAVLAERHRPERSDLMLVENGVNPARFAVPVARPDDLPPGNAPLIGYHGAIAEWFDFELAEAVARRRSDWRFLFVGPVEPAVRREAARLADLDNVTLLGERPPAAIPGYVQAFDVGTVWFRIDRLTEAVSPLKVFECLAAGTPVVSTPLPACTRIAAVRTAATPKGFEIALESALGDAADPDFATTARGLAAEAAWGARLAPARARLERSGRLRMPEEEP